VLAAENKKQLFIPRGFAHGFLTLEDDTEFVYKCDEFYHPEDEGGILYNSLPIDWENYFDVSQLIISEKDKKNQTFETFNSPF
jgi:dTDP-4-dehydrorhamnose 3,5-epimerase